MDVVSAGNQNYDDLNIDPDQSVLKYGLAILVSGAVSLMVSTIFTWVGEKATSGEVQRAAEPQSSDYRELEQFEENQFWRMADCINLARIRTMELEARLTRFQNIRQPFPEGGATPRSVARIGRKV